MFRLLETIRIEDGRLLNLPYHEERVNRSLHSLYCKRELPGLEKIIEIPGLCMTGIFKCRFLYSDKRFSVSFLTYSKRSITSIFLVEDPGIKYELKYADRSELNKLLPENKPGAEIIITRGGMLTDTSYTNIALERNGKWLTPEPPLLEGTQRALLIDQGILQLEKIHTGQLGSYSKIRLFNAMMPWDDCIELDINKISINE